MIAIIVVEKETTKENITKHLTPRGFDVIHYHNPVKAMDNLEEITPDLVVFSGEDFPRHWKPFIRVLRNFRTKEESVFVLLRGELFPFDEGIKASSLQVNGIIKEDFDDPRTVVKLEEIIARYEVLKDFRLDKRHLSLVEQDLEFLFTHPEKYTLVTGEIIDISLGGLSFKPDQPQYTADILEGTKVDECSLRVQDTVWTTDIKIARNNVNLGISFISPPEELVETLKKYVNSFWERELEAAKN